MYGNDTAKLRPDDGGRLRIVPDHFTLWWFGRSHLSPSLLAAIVEETVAQAAGTPRGPRLVALDSTGLWLSHASRYFEWRASQTLAWPARLAEVGTDAVGRAAAPAGPAPVRLPITHIWGDKLTGRATGNG